MVGGQQTLPDWLTLVQQLRAIAVIRASNLEVGQQMAQAVAAGGIQLVEVTWHGGDAARDTTYRPAELVKVLRQELPHCVVGAGTLLNLADLEEAIAAGAAFCFTPHTAPHLIRSAVEHQVPIIAGALTPTEIVTAWQAGATCVKVFPVKALGGVSYLQALREPLGEIPLIPTGGVTVDNARTFLDAGAVAVALGGQLFPKDAIARGAWEVVTQQALRLMEEVQQPIA